MTFEIVLIDLKKRFATDSGDVAECMANIAEVLGVKEYYIVEKFL